MATKKRDTEPEPASVRSEGGPRSKRSTERTRKQKQAALSHVMLVEPPTPPKDAPIQTTQRLEGALQWTQPLAPMPLTLEASEPAHLGGVDLASRATTEASPAEPGTTVAAQAHAPHGAVELPRGDDDARAEELVVLLETQEAISALRNEVDALEGILDLFPA